MNRYNYCVSKNIRGRDASYLYKWPRTIANYLDAWDDVKPESVKNGFRKMFTELLDYFEIRLDADAHLAQEKRQVKSRKNGY